MPQLRCTTSGYSRCAMSTSPRAISFSACMFTWRTPNLVTVLSTWVFRNVSSALLLLIVVSSRLPRLCVRNLEVRPTVLLVPVRRSRLKHLVSNLVVSRSSSAVTTHSISRPWAESSSVSVRLVLGVALMNLTVWRNVFFLLFLSRSRIFRLA